MHQLSSYVIEWNSMLRAKVFHWELVEEIVITNSFVVRHSFDTFGNREVKKFQQFPAVHCSFMR